MDMSFYLALGIALVFMLLAVVVLFFVGRWVYRDASAKGLQAGLWTAIAVLVPNLIGLLIYCVYRADKKPLMECKNCHRKIEMNVSFCPWCGYQSPPASAPAPYSKVPKKLILLIVVPVLLLFGLFSTVVIIGFNRYGGYSRYDRSHILESVPISAYEDGYTYDYDYDYVYGYDDTQGDYPYAAYESIEENHYTYSTSELKETHVIKFNIPEDPTIMHVTLSYKGKAEPLQFTIENLNDHIISMNRSRNDDEQEYYEAFYDISYITENQLTITLQPQKTLENVSMNVIIE